MILRVLLVSLCCLLVNSVIAQDGMKLQLVQIVWRHGDRNPTDPYPGDPYDEPYWDTRGGYGQLTTLGMKMHVELGSKIRRRYVDELNFLGPSYSPKEIYVRSTDVNRTILSAVSNMIGMYGQGAGSKAGTQYPQFDAASGLSWPGAYVPIPIHTVDDDTDYLGNANAFCPRQDALWALAMAEAPEVQKLRDDPMTKQVIATIASAINVTYKVDQLWIPHDVLFIENFNHLKMPSWWSQGLQDNLTTINNQIEDLQDGIGLAPLHGINFTVELPKLRAGSLTNDMMMHMNLKLSCIGKATPECKWINGLKYYAYSAHDETVASLLATLGAKHSVVPNGYPVYAAAALVELYTDSKNNQYFKLLYHEDTPHNFTIVTDRVTGCSTGQEYCSLDVFRKQANLYSPGDAAKLCMDTYLVPTPAPPKKSASTLGALFALVLTVSSLFI